MARPTVIHLDLSALKHNLDIIHSFSPHRKILAMLKANAYGHGAIPIAHALSDSVSAIGFACLEEAIELSEAGITTPIILMAGFFEADELSEIIKRHYQLVIHSFSQIAALEKLSVKEPLTIWMKIDTGMHRLGFLPEELERAHTRLMASSAVAKPIHYMTHFACADESENRMTDDQAKLFLNLTKNLPGEKSLLNSAALLAHSNIASDWIRPGIALYGISPFENKTGVDFNLKPVMTLASKLILIRELKKGERVGYGSEWVCPETMKVGVIPIGYGDGYPRSAKEGTPILVGDTLCPLVGRVSMDMITVDLRHCEHSQEGQSVILWGKGLPVETIASFAGRSPYELLCSVHRAPCVVD